MSNIDEVLRYSDLLNIYQNLLTKTQKEILEDYFFYNLSLSEIAENRNISRSAVEDAIKKGKKKLDNFEIEIGSLKILSLVTELKNKTKDPDELSKLEQIERIIKHGIWILKW